MPKIALSVSAPFREGARGDERFYGHDEGRSNIVTEIVVEKNHIGFGFRKDCPLADGPKLLPNGLRILLILQNGVVKR